MVPRTGLEPVRLFESADFKSAVSTIPPPRRGESLAESSVKCKSFFS